MKDIPYQQAGEEIAKLIDYSFMKNESLKQIHKEQVYMPYTMNSLYPLEQDGIYKEGKIYSFIIRTLSSAFEEHFVKVLCHTYTDKLKALSTQAYKCSRKLIDRIYSITPAILKIPDVGYWRDQISVDEFERIFKGILHKKYQYFYNEKLDEGVELYRLLKFDNKKPIAVKFKNITLLGDKVTIHVAENEIAQKLFFMALAVGIIHNGARGSGFINAKYY